MFSFWFAKFGDMFFPDFNEVTTHTHTHCWAHSIDTSYFQNCHLLQSSVMHLQHDATHYPNIFFKNDACPNTFNKETSRKFRVFVRWESPMNKILARSDAKLFFVYHGYHDITKSSYTELLLQNKPTKSSSSTFAVLKLPPAMHRFQMIMSIIPW